MHSFIFYGPNGTGKTTSARLFARAINCPNFAKLEKICDECDPCQISGKNHCIDIIEIDGATNNGVEFVREINKDSLYPPLKLSKKLYIIDEAHCLSLQSWNALLKLIEEPPEHLIIILITTEIQKIIPTILSRCQKLNFPSLNNENILSILSKIAEIEKHSIKEGILEEIIANSKGSVRESLVLLEQHFLNKNQESLVNLPTINADAMQLLQLIFDSQTSNSLKKLEEMETNFSSIFESILNHLLELSFYSIGKESEDFLSYFSKEQAKVLINSKKDITTMINFLATNIYPANSIFSLAYAKFLLLNLLQISSKNINQQKTGMLLAPEKEILITTKKKEGFENDKYGKTPLKAVLSETISDREDDSEIPKPEDIFLNSILVFNSFDLPQFEFQEILSKEEKIIQILKECKKTEGKKYFQELQNYLESENPILLISELFKNIHPKYKFICSDENCLVIFADNKESQYFNLKLKNWKIQEMIYSVFSKPIDFHSISLGELPSLIEKKKIHEHKKLKQKLLSTQEEKLFEKIHELFNLN